MSDVLSDIIAEAERIRREKNNRALTPDEAKTLMADRFLRKVAPWAYESTESEGARGPRADHE